MPLILVNLPIILRISFSITTVSLSEITIWLGRSIKTLTALFPPQPSNEKPNRDCNHCSSGPFCLYYMVAVPFANAASTATTVTIPLGRNANDSRWCTGVIAYTKRRCRGL